MQRRSGAMPPRHAGRRPIGWRHRGHRDFRARAGARRLPLAVAILCTMVPALTTASALALPIGTPAGAATQRGEPSSCRIVEKPTYDDYTICKDADLKDVRLDKADLHLAVFDRTTFTGGSAVGAFFAHSYLSDAKLTDVDLDKAYLLNLGIEGATFTHVTFAGASVGDFFPQVAKKATFTNDDFTGAYLFGSFKHVTIQHPNFTDANLSGANFTGADLSGAIWSNTTCPDRTNSDRDGGTCAGHLSFGTWVYVSMKLASNGGFTSSCNVRFATAGTQECHGVWVGRTEPADAIPGWPYAHGDNGGTIFSTIHPPSARIDLALDAPGGEIDGYIDNEQSNRFSITHSTVGNKHDTIVTPPGADDEPPGSQGGPLKLDVSGSCTVADVCRYDFNFEGWVVLLK